MWPASRASRGASALLLAQLIFSIMRSMKLGIFSFCREPFGREAAASMENII